MPPADLSGSYKVTLTISDPYKGNVTDTFDMKINSKPVVSPTNGAISPTYLSSQGVFRIDAAKYFYDKDTIAGDALTYSVKHPNNQAVGSWVTLFPNGTLAFNSTKANVGWNYF